MKIFEIGTGYTPIPAQMGAATEIVVEELTRSFIRNGETVEIIDIKAQNRAGTELPISEVNVPAVFTKTDVSLGILHKLKRVMYSVSLARKLKKILKDEKEQIVLHFHNQYNMFFFLKMTPKSLQKKAVLAYTVHSYIWHGDWNAIEDVVKKRYFQELHCMQCADCVFVLNEKTRGNILTHMGLDPEKVVLIDNGVNTDVYIPLSESEKASVKAHYGLQGKKVFVQVGSVCERKNQLTAIELLLPFLQKNKDFVFCYAGGIISADYQASILRFAQENGVGNQVIYAGELQPGQQLNAFYNLAEAMVFPSKAEGFSLVIIEAMAAGVPVLVHDSLQFELAGSCMQYKDNAMFADKLNNEILDSEKQKLASGYARHIVEEKYSWHKIAEDYSSVFTKCV